MLCAKMYTLYYVYKNNNIKVTKLKYFIG